MASSAGALFVRSYERGERVHLAMLSRGYTGSMPDLSRETAGPGQWGAALVVPLAAALVAGVAWVLR
jgi:cobalt/nickel transport system permease protein